MTDRPSLPNRLRYRWGKNLSQEERILRAVFNVHNDGWWHRPMSWACNRYGEDNPHPWYINLVMRPFLWIADWDLALAIRRPVKGQSDDRPTTTSLTLSKPKTSTPSQGLITVHFMDGPLAGCVRTYWCMPSTIYQSVAAGSPSVHAFTHVYECVDEIADGVYKARQTAMWVGEPHFPKEFSPTRRDLEDLLNSKENPDE